MKKKFINPELVIFVFKEEFLTTGPSAPDTDGGIDLPIDPIDDLV